ncbi:MAG: entericidin A/B family lipoprotein [Verrucomicrobiota bacterium]
MKTKFCYLALMSLLLLGGSGCNTMEGLGEDLQNLGRGIQDSADKAED